MRLRVAVIGSISFFVASCSDVGQEATQAESEGRIISNEMMQVMYPETFKKGEPPYLERDFEAGADFICDEIEREFSRDVCADEPIKWRD